MLPLKNKTILYTGVSGAQSPLVSLLEKAGGNVISCPTISIEGARDGYQQLQTDLQKGLYHKWPALFFTSKNGVSHLSKALEPAPPGPADELRKIPACVVGRATAQAARDGHFTIALTAAGRSAAALGKEFMANLPIALPKTDFEFPLFLGKLAGQELEHAFQGKYNTRRYNLYTTKPLASDQLHKFTKTLATKKVDLLLFTSPSGFKNFTATGIDPRAYPAAAIGQTTAQAMVAAGVQPVVVPTAPEADAFAQSIIDYFRR